MRPLLAFFLIAVSPAYAWWDEGHQVIARIAAQHLTPEAREQVAELLEVENTPQSVADAMAKAAIWADQMKGEGDGITANWHFVNLAWQDNRADLANRCAGNDCLVARLRSFAAQLKANKTDDHAPFNDADALRFVIHLVGDLHQPLHVASDADQGGNCLQLSDFVESAENIHAVWDGPLVTRMNSDDVALASELNAEIGDMSRSELAEYTSGSINDWAWESHRLAMLHVYKRLEIPKEDLNFSATCAEAPEEIRELKLVIDDNYLNEMQPVVRSQLKKAGLRLANMLNDILP